MEDILTEEDREQVKIILECIKKFEDGDDSCYDDILNIIEGIRHFSHKSSYTILREKLIIALSRIVTGIQSCLNDEVVSLYGECDNYLDYYTECIEILSEYLKVGKKTGDYPDLEAAYLLTVYLSGMLYNISDYLEEIRKIVKSILSGYIYFRSPSLSKKCEERKETVNTLVNSIKKTS